jgi:hypothetical protein
MGGTPPAQIGRKLRPDGYWEIVMEELLDSGNVLFGRKGNGKL